MSRVILSHDVDHLSAYEHWRDLIVPKFLVRSAIERATGMIRTRELIAKMTETLAGRWSFVDEVAKFDAQHGIRSTFFFAAGTGLGLTYAAEAARPVCERVIAAGHEVGIHGLARTNIDAMRREKGRFEQVYGRRCDGIRLHYLAADETILTLARGAGYAYDCSLRGDGPVRVVDGFVHFPLHVMDCDVFHLGRPYQTSTMMQAVASTRERVSRLVDRGVDFVSILFHDRYFSAAHRAWSDWYCAVVEWVAAQRLATCCYGEAVEALRRTSRTGAVPAESVSGRERTS